MTLSAAERTLLQEAVLIAERHGKVLLALDIEDLMQADTSSATPATYPDTDTEEEEL